jgi:uncharacterized protein DUF4252
MKPSTSILRAVGLASVLAALAAPGCFSSSELANVRYDLQHQLPGASFKKNVEFSCGPVLLTLARTVTTIIPGAREARPYLSGVSQVSIGVYDAHVDSLGDVRMPKRLQSLIDDGWETAIRVRDNHEAAWLLYRPDEDRVKEIFIVVLDDDELVLVKARGNLEHLVAAALESEHGRRSFHDVLHG